MIFRKLLSYKLPIFVVIVLLLSTAFSFFYFKDDAIQDDFNSFESTFIAESEGFSIEFDLTLAQYESLLRASRGLFEASDSVSRDEWKRFFESQRSTNAFPALSALGFVRRVSDQDFSTIESHSSGVAGDGYPDFVLNPPGEREEYYVVDYLEPIEENASAFGFDIFSQEDRRTAIEIARDTGSPSITAPINLVQETGEAKAFLYLIPVYDGPASTLSERRENIIGLISAVVRAEDIVTQVFRNYESEALQNISIVDVTEDERDLVPNIYLNDSTNANGQVLTNTRSIEKAHRSYLISTNSVPYDASATPTNGAYVALVLGSVISALAGYVLYSSSKTRERSVEIADKLTKDFRSTNEMFSIATKNANIGVWEWSFPEDEITWSDELYDIVDIPRETEITPDGFYSTFEDDARQSFELFINDVRSSRKASNSISVDSDISTPQGKKSVNLNATAIFNGEKFEKVIGTVQDLTERSDLENKIKNQLRGAEESKAAMANLLEDLSEEKKLNEEYAKDLQKFKQAADYSTDGIVITRTDSTIIYVNEAWSKMTKYTREEAIGKNPSILKSGKTDESIYKELWESITNGEKFITEDLINKRKDGSEYQAQLSVYPIMSGDEISFYVGLETDITKRKEVEKAKSEFVSIASHQLRTPLSTINWYTEMLMSGDAGDVNDKQKEYLNEVYVGSQRMVALVNALLNVSRIELGTFAVSPEPTDITSMARSVMDEVKPIVDEKRIKISLQKSDDYTISADPKLLRIVFQNLITNAVKYTDEEGSVEIDISVCPKGTKCRANILDEDFLKVVVKDTGYGIPEKDQDKIFSKLFRADNVKERDTEGTGLGLYIVKSIIEGSGGEVWFESKESEGTKFFFTVPMSGMKEKDGEKELK